MKTAVEELIDDLLSGKITDTLANKEYYIEKERKQIIDAYDSGNRKGYDEHILSASFDLDETYYNETYKNDKL